MTARTVAWGLLLVAPLLAGSLLGRGDAFLVLAGVGLALSSWIAWRWPLAAVGVVLLAVGGYSIFQTTPVFVPDALYFGRPVAFHDVVLVGMLVAAALRLVNQPTRRRVKGLLVPTAAVFVWLAVGVLRNWPSVGPSALNELRFRYLLLAAALLLVASPRDRIGTRRALNVFLVIAVGLPIILSPIVLYLNGWVVGPGDHRMFPSHVSMGVLLGLITLWQCRSWVSIPRPVLWFVTALGSIEILVDAHRSVWLAAAAALLVIGVSRPDTVSRVRLIAAIAVAGVAATLLTLFTSLEVWGILDQQGGEALAVEGTARWRLLVWQASLQQFLDAPVIGRGLGLYWSAYISEFGREITMFPHSLYIMVLVHLGIVGMLLFCWLWLAGWRSLFRFRRQQPVPDSQGCEPSELAWLGMAAMAASAAYCVAYGFDPYSLTLAGICLGGLVAAKRYKQPRGTRAARGTNDPLTGVPQLTSPIGP